MSSSEAIDQIVSSPSLHAETRAAVFALRALSTTPASREAVTRILARALAVFPPPARSEAEWSAWWAAYFEALGGLSEHALEAAMAAYIKLPDSEFFPKPGALRELAFNVPNAAAVAYHRASTAARQIEAAAKPARPLDELTMAGQREAVRKMMAEAGQRLRAPPAPSGNLRPPVQARVDETGISPQIRDLLRREQEG